MPGFRVVSAALTEPSLDRNPKSVSPPTAAQAAPRWMKARRFIDRVIGILTKFGDKVFDKVEFLLWFGQKLFDLLHEIFGGIDIAKFAAFVQQPHDRNFLDAELFGKPVLGSFWIIKLGPIDLFLCDEGEQVLVVVVGELELVVDQRHRHADAGVDVKDRRGVGRQFDAVASVPGIDFEWTGASGFAAKVRFRRGRLRHNRQVHVGQKRRKRSFERKRDRVVISGIDLVHAEVERTRW